MYTSVEYSTMPLALVGARSRSTMTALRGSLGSASPYARPTSFSYWPTLPNERPSNVGDSTRVMSRRVIPPEPTGCGWAACATGPTPAVSASTTATTERRSTRWILPTWSLAFDSADDQALDHQALGKRVHEDRRQRGDERAGHHLAPVEDVLAKHLRQADGDRARGERVGDDQRVQELVPGLGEREQTHDHESRRGQGQDDAQQHAQSVAAIDERGFLQLERDALEVAHQQPGTERQRDGRVDEDERPDGVRQANAGHHLEERDEQQRLGHKVREHETEGDDAPAGEAQPGDG